MSFLSEVQRDCTEAERDLGSAIMVWSGASYPVAGSLQKRGDVLVVGGKEVEITITLRVRYAGTTAGGREWTFAVLPRPGDRITYKNRDLRIARVNNAHETFLELDLMDLNR